MKNALKWTCIVGLFIALALPLYISNSLYFPFITGKSFVFRIITEIIFGAWLILMLLDRKYRPKTSWVLWGYSAFILVLTIADIFGINPYKSFWSNYERMEGLIEHLHLYAYFIVAISVLQTEKLWNAFWKTALGVTVIMTFYGFAQAFGKVTINQGGTRVDGTLGNAAYMAIFMYFGLFIAALFWVRAKETWQKWLYGIIAVGELIVLYYTQTRGTMLGLLAAGFLIALIIALFGKENKKLRMWSASAIAVLIILVGGFIALRNASFIRNNQVLARFATISLTERTTQSRFMVWNMAFQGFKERPILGWGQDNFNYVFNKYYDPGMYNQEQWFDRTHDVFLDWLIAGGIFGLLTYLFLFGAVGVAVWKSRLSLVEKSLLSGLLIGYFIHNIFVFDNFVSYLLYFSFAAYLHFETTKGKVEARESDAPLINTEVTHYGLMPVVAILVIVSIYFLNVRPIQAARTLVDALKVAGSAPEQELGIYQKAIGYGTFGNAEIRERLMLDVVSFGVKLPQAEQAKVLQYATEQMQLQIEQSKNDARYLLFMGSFLNRIGDTENALMHLERAHQASPRKQSIIIEQGVAYLGKQDYANTLAKFKQAYELAPEYVDARIIYALGALYAKDVKLSDSILAGIEPSVLLKDERLLGTYASLGMYDRVLAIWQERVKLNPSDPQTRLSLVATYLKVNRRADAIKELEDIEKAFPQHAQQVQEYITQIKAGKNPIE